MRTPASNTPVASQGGDYWPRSWAQGRPSSFLALDLCPWRSHRTILPIIHLALDAAREYYAAFNILLNLNNLLALFRKTTSIWPANIDADRHRNRFPVPAPLQERRVDWLSTASTQNKAFVGFVSQFCARSYCREFSSSERFAPSCETCKLTGAGTSSPRRSRCSRSSWLMAWKSCRLIIVSYRTSWSKCAEKGDPPTKFWFL